MNTSQEHSVIEHTIVALNHWKIQIDDLEMTREMNAMQRALEIEAGRTAVELDDRYNV